MDQNNGGGRPSPKRDRTEWESSLLYQVARLYYLEDCTQAQIADRMGVSRSTVSRLLSEARTREIVRIELVPPSTDPHSADRAGAVAELLGLKHVWLAPTAAEAHLGHSLAPAVSSALTTVGLRRGDGLLVSSGATMYALSHEPFISMPGVFVAPTVGGLDQPEAYYQTNEIIRRIAELSDAIAVQLHAPALTSPELYRLLRKEPSIHRVTELWKSARAALLGIGAPPLTRSSLPTVMAGMGKDALATAVGDLCTRPFDIHGQPLAMPAHRELVAIGLDDLRRIPFAIAVGVGEAKVEAIMAASDAGYINCLVTDLQTADLLLDA